MDVYLYIQAESGLTEFVMNSIVQSGLATRAAIVTGPFDVFARIDDIGWDELAERMIDGVHRMPGIVRTETAAAVPPEALGFTIPNIGLPLRGATKERVALVFASLEAGTGSDTLTSLTRVKSVLGLALVTGKHDVILQVAGKGLNEIAATVVREIQAVPGIAETSTALVLRSTPLPKRKGT